ncbi:1784_t:CDS:2 [Funneliformis caledonium]|uniref:1784_t:CDS:1 n=1 Tax=Funneliformis caledonium TaxID=1117310 RepID=A0A9N9B7T2_9GLOM|nr:1784_t:CDS:2 [Funneliformis caledonium]
MCNNSSHQLLRCHNPMIIFIILICFITFCSAQNAQYDNTLTFYEDAAKDLYFFDSFTESDGTLLIQLAHYNNPEQTCIDPDIHLRVVYANGTVKPLKVAHRVPSYNFCMLQDVFMNYFINEYMILITYFEGKDDATTMHTGMVIDFDGNLLQYFTLGIGIGEINRNKNKETGFTWSRQVNTSTIAWSRFIADPSNPMQILNLGTGFIHAPNPSSTITSYKLLSSGDGGNCLVIVTKLNQLYASDPAWEVYAFFIDKSAAEVSLPYLLYQSQINLYKIEFLRCRNSNGEGYKCLMLMETLVTAAKQAEVSTIKRWHLLTFLTSGSVISNKKIDSGNDFEKREILDASILFNGGFLIIFAPLKDNIKTGILLTQNGDFEGVWKGFSGEVIHYAYLEHNDTLWGVLFQQTSASWTIMTDTLRVMEFNYKHRNPNILETKPTDDVIRYKGEIITIQYDKPIIPSSGNISIYQVVDDHTELLRQTYSGLSSYVTIANDTVGIIVFKSTFNNPNATYFVQINDDFVSSRRYNEAMSGINKRVWFLNASIEEPSVCKSSVTILLKLNSKGTEYFKTLNSKEIDAFFIELMNELSEIIPIERSRLPDTTGKFQHDPLDSNNLILLQVKISQPTESTRPCAKDIVSDLDALITNKHSTLIARYPLSSMLDENYGTVMTAEGWNNTLKFTLILLLSGFLFVSILFFLAWPLYVVLKEQQNHDEFRAWFKNYTPLVSIFTILSSADVELLNVISSEIWDSKYLSAPLSNEAKLVIFWGSFANIFLEDVPQFIIRVIYLQHNSIIYDPIPVISLISAGISILFSLIGRGYDTLNHEVLFSKKSETKKSDEINNDDSNNTNNNFNDNSDENVEEKIEDTIKESNDGDNSNEKVEEIIEELTEDSNETVMTT